MSGLVFKEADELVQRLRIGCTNGVAHMNGFPTFQKYTLNVICRLAFGDAMDNIEYLQDEEITKDINNMFRWMYRRTVSPFPPLFWHIYRDSCECAGTDAVKRLDAVVSEVLENYRLGKRGDATFLRTLMEASESYSIDDVDSETKSEPRTDVPTKGGLESTDAHTKKDHLTDEEVAAQVKLFIIAGTETTSTLIAATVWQLCLSKNAPLVNELRNEVDQVLGQDGCVRTNAQWEQLQLVRATLKETNRLYGPVHNLGAQPTYANQELPGGYIVQPKVYSYTSCYDCCALPPSVTASPFLSTNPTGLGDCQHPRPESRP
jgi:cytochrome P450